MGKRTKITKAQKTPVESGEQVTLPCMELTTVSGKTIQVSPCLAEVINPIGESEVCIEVEKLRLVLPREAVTSLPYKKGSYVKVKGTESKGVVMNYEGMSEQGLSFKIKMQNDDSIIYAYEKDIEPTEAFSMEKKTEEIVFAPKRKRRPKIRY